MHYDERATTGTRTRPLDAGRLLIGLGALALLISLFLDWYGEPGSGSAITAWSSFELVDLLLAALAIVAIYSVAEGIAPGRTPTLPGGALWLAGPTALVLVLASIVDEPPLVAALDPTLEAGVWIALVAALAMTIGAVLSTMRISLVVGAREPDQRVDPEQRTRPLRTEPGHPAPGAEGPPRP